MFNLFCCLRLVLSYLKTTKKHAICRSKSKTPLTDTRLALSIEQWKIYLYEVQQLLNCPWRLHSPESAKWLWVFRKNNLMLRQQRPCKMESTDK